MEQVHAVQRAIKPVAIQKKPVDELLEFIGRAKEFAQWLWILDRLIALAFRVPSKAVYDALQKCPTYSPDSDRNLRQEIFDGLRNSILEGLTTENIAGYERKFMTLVQAASFVGRAELLRAKVLVTLAYKTANLPVPHDVRERLAGCERFHREQLERKGLSGAYDIEELKHAGYAFKHANGTLEVWIHPETKDSMTRSTNTVARRTEREEGRREGKKHGAEAMFAHAPAPKQLVLNRAGKLIEVRKHKPIVALSPEERKMREQAAEAERKRKADLAAAKAAKESSKKKNEGKKKK